MNKTFEIDFNSNDDDEIIVEDNRGEYQNPDF